MSLLDKLKSKPKSPKQPISLDEVREMSARGISDKDIIKTFKTRGYSYDDIEKIMLQAVKEGVSAEDPIQATPEPIQNPLPPEKPQNDQEMTGMYPNQEKFTPPPEPIQQEQVLDDSIQDDQYMHEDVSPEIIVEELVEGVVEEKWKKFDKGLSNVEKDLENMKVANKQMQQKVGALKPAEDTTELVIKLNELSERVEDFEARVGGLEKAFRQFLPSLTTNIENLSSIIHEMKAKKY